MKVNGPNGPGPINSAGQKPKSAEGGFSLGETENAGTSAQTARVADAAPLSSLDALIALQAYPSGGERRKRAVRRASRILDHLDAMKLALLEGTPDAASLTALAEAVREARDETSDPRLEEVLNEIETRAAVELAKREAARR